ncbi:MAG: topoisomerase DNA-binding C4 zinc finger domain-containing protein [Clostridia bacterium]|nr:topoisomerase DNA-binding C4 zinc finger domain-containing protein [Clostridia bacterium]
MGKQIIDLIGEFVSISGNSTVDSIIFAIIGTISFLVAFGIVGWLFDAIGRYDSDLMSDAHWIIRVLVFAGLTWLGVKIAHLIKWLFSFQWWIYVITGVVFVGIIILIYYIKSRVSKNNTYSAPTIEASKIGTTAQSEEKEEPQVVMTINKADDRYYCPRCHSKLVKRHGPYGDFYGCESYGKTGCRYTRKFL